MGTSRVTVATTWGRTTKRRIRQAMPKHNLSIGRQGRGPRKAGTRHQAAAQANRVLEYGNSNDLSVQSPFIIVSGSVHAPRKNEKGISGAGTANARVRIGESPFSLTEWA